MTQTLGFATQKKGGEMESERFAEILHETYLDLPVHLVQHVSMFLSSDQRLAFLDFIGVEY